MTKAIWLGEKFSEKETSYLFGFLNVELSVGIDPSENSQKDNLFYQVNKIIKSSRCC